MNTSKRNLAGFTLIEVMVVVAIIAILSAIAYPSYTEYLARGRRADAKGALLEGAQRLERQYTISNTYVGATLPTLRTTTGQYYTWSLGWQGTASAPSATNYWITIVPNQTDARCGTYSLDGKGNINVTGSSGLTYCWNR